MRTISNKDFDLLVKMKQAAGLPPIDINDPIIKWKPKEQECFFDQDGAVCYAESHLLTNIGRERSTRELCKIASDRTIRSNLISAWLDSEGSGEQEFNTNFTLYLIYKGEKWYKSAASYFYPDTVYMFEQDALNICKALNSGEFEL